MTTLMPSIVMAVSAILDAKINLCYFVFAKAFFCYSGVSLPCNGMTMKTLWLSFFLKISANVYISLVSAQKTNMWPLYLSLSIFLYVKSYWSIALSIFLTIYSSLDGKYLIVTGYILPETLRVFFLKYFSKSEISIDADVIITLNPFLFVKRSLTNPRMTSMLIVLSWASSITRHE